MSRDAEGWKAEFRISFSQLRFETGKRDTFGFGVIREIGRLNESSSWPIIAKSRTGFVSQLGRKSWTGMDIHYEPFHLAWRLDPDHELPIACRAAYTETFGSEPDEYDFWDFSTNAVTPVSMGIPTIGFGPGDYKLAHMRNENCEVEQIIDACRFHTGLIEKI